MLQRTDFKIVTCEVFKETNNSQGNVQASKDGSAALNIANATSWQIPSVDTSPASMQKQHTTSDMIILCKRLSNASLSDESMLRAAFSQQEIIIKTLSKVQTLAEEETGQKDSTNREKEVKVEAMPVRPFADISCKSLNESLSRLEPIEEDECLKCLTTRSPNTSGDMFEKTFISSKSAIFEELDNNAHSNRGISAKRIRQQSPNFQSPLHKILRSSSPLTGTDTSFTNEKEMSSWPTHANNPNTEFCIRDVCK